MNRTFFLWKGTGGLVTLSENFSTLVQLTFVCNFLSSLVFELKSNHSLFFVYVKFGTRVLKVVKNNFVRGEHGAVVFFFSAIL